MKQLYNKKELQIKNSCLAGFALQRGANETIVPNSRCFCTTARNHNHTLWVLFLHPDFCCLFFYLLFSFIFTADDGVLRRNVLHRNIEIWKKVFALYCVVHKRINYTDEKMHALKTHNVLMSWQSNIKLYISSFFWYIKIQLLKSVDIA